MDGAYCSPNGSGDAGTCKAFAPKDGSCAGGTPCAPGQICLNDVCSDAPPGDVGDACSGIGACKPGNDCDAGTCKAKAAAGPAECFVGFQGLGACQGLGTEGDPTNTCVAFCGSNGSGARPTSGATTPRGARSLARLGASVRRGRRSRSSPGSERRRASSRQNALRSEISRFEMTMRWICPVPSKMS